MSRRTARRVSLVFLFLVAGLFIYLGFRGWVVNDALPTQYLGYLLLAFAVAGLLGFNIWYGGPFDTRLDATSGKSPSAPPVSVSSSHVAMSNIEQRGLDTYADVHVQESWVEEERMISVESPGRDPIQIKLPAVAKEGTQLRLPGGTADGTGNLVLRIRLVR